MAIPGVEADAVGRALELPCLPLCPDNTVERDEYQKCSYNKVETKSEQMHKRHPSGSNAVSTTKS
jgi:hypothetical protein